MRNIIQIGCGKVEFLISIVSLRLNVEHVTKEEQDLLHLSYFPLVDNYTYILCKDLSF